MTHVCVRSRQISVLLRRYIVHLECVIMSVYEYKQYTVKHKPNTGFIKVYFLQCFVQRHVSAEVMSHHQVDYFS
jgi:hypothetical protein